MTVDSITLTTDNAASSCGVPVAVIAGEACGPADTRGIAGR
jgi:hypothetical protein